MAPPHLKRTHSSVPSLEIQLTPDSAQNVLLIRGTPDSAQPVRLTGQISISSEEALTIRRLTIKLVGTMRLKWDETINVGRMQPTTHPIRYEKTSYEQDLDLTESLSLSGSASNTRPGSGSTSRAASGKSTPKGSMTNLASYFSASHSNGHSSGGSGSSSNAQSPTHTPRILSRASSSLNVPGLKTDTPTPGKLSRASSSMSLHALKTPKLHSMESGPHSIPFELVIPGSINESIEGNSNAQIVYWLVATAERGRFQHNLTARKHIRVVRTLGVDTYDSAQSISIENTWPGKVDYTIEVPSKAIAIGSQTDVHFQLQPQQKGLRIGKVKIALSQTLAMHLPSTQHTSIETIVAEETYRMDEEQVALYGDHIGDDEWIFSRSLQMPTSLSKCSQGCLVKPNVHITHKLKAAVGLINSDGHVSELRASLPVILFVSPRIPVSEDNELQEDMVYGLKDHTIFGEADGAPPNYRSHVYDRLYSEVATPFTPGSPIHSGASTPSWLPHPHSSLAHMDASQREQLTAGLQALALSRNQAYELSAQTPPVDVQQLSRVPSYDHALRDQAAQEFAPKYED